MKPMQNESNGNGNGGPSKVLWWILGGIIGPMILALANTVQGSSNRIAVLEAEFREIKSNLTIIQQKLDRLFDRRP